ncbi:MAG: bifunctional DNA primase/helicase [Pedobacter sp.]
MPKNTVDWFFKRGISQQTLIDFKITQSEEWMPQTGKKERCIQFNYFRSEELVNIKYRTGHKHFKLFKDAELIMYNIDSIVDSDECIICEGEIDAMSWHEAGFKNVVSVPNGASKGARLEYIDNCYKYFEHKTKIFLSTDNDEPGIALRDELCRRFGIERCYKVNLGDYKDANEALQNGFKLTLDTATIFPIEGVFTINDVWDDIEDIYNHGLPAGDKTGDIGLDNHIGFMPGELTMVTGIPGHGKSIYLDQVSVGLAINSNWSFAVCSPESYPIGFYYTRLIKRILGKKFSKYNITPGELQEVKDWIADRYNIIMPGSGFNLDTILEKAKALVLRKGIKGLIIDPWNRIENNISEGKDIISNLLKIINFNQQTGVHTFLVAHPTKMPKKEDGINYVIPNLYSISGSAHFFNMTQNGMTVYRNYSTQETEVYIQKVKWEHLGKIGQVNYKYMEENARFVGEGIEPYASWIAKKELTAIQPNLNFDKNEEEFDLF